MASVIAPVFPDVQSNHSIKPGSQESDKIVRAPDQFAFESRVETEGTNSLSDTFTDGFAHFPMYNLRARKNMKNSL